jgi:hypothetical protein
VTSASWCRILTISALILQKILSPLLVAPHVLDAEEAEIANDIRKTSEEETRMAAPIAAMIQDASTDLARRCKGKE